MVHDANYTGSEYKIELLEGAKPYNAKSFLIPKMHKETLKTEVKKLIKINVSKPKKLQAGSLNLHHCGNP